MQTSTETEVQIEGLFLEEIDADISALTIDLQDTITADGLATLLRGLADFYKVGVRLDGRDYDPFVTFASSGGLSAQSSDELLIAHLIIGTPNKVRLLGRTRWLKDLRALILALALFLPPGPAHDHTIEANFVVGTSISTVNVPPPPPPPPPPPAHVNTAELSDQFYKNIEAQQTLDTQFHDEKISLSEYIELRAALERARKDLTDAMSTTRARVKQ